MFLTAKHTVAPLAPLANLPQELVVPAENVLTQMSALKTTAAALLLADASMVNLKALTVAPTPHAPTQVQIPAVAQRDTIKLAAQLSQTAQKFRAQQKVVGTLQKIAKQKMVTPATAKQTETTTLAHSARLVIFMPIIHQTKPLGALHLVVQLAKLWEIAIA